MKRGQFFLFLILILLIPFLAATPSFTFNNPTPSNATVTSNTSIIINSTITEPDLKSLVYNWNSTNYSMMDGLFAWFNFNNVSSLGENDTLVTSFGSPGLNGTPQDNATPVQTGKYGGAYNFDGDGDYIDLGTPSNLASLQINFTIMGWFNETGVGVRPIIFGQYGSTSNSQLVKLIRLDGDKLNYFTSTAAGSFQSKAFSTTYTQNTWHFFAVRVNGSMSSPRLLLYLDGTSQQFVLNALSTTPDTSVPIWIGRSSADVDTEDYSGMIDELQIYNRTLGLDEINLAYMSNLRRYNANAWNFYINQSKDGINGLDEGNYTYQITGTDSSNNFNSSEQRTVIINFDPDSPIWFNNNTNINSASSGSVYFNITFNDTNPDKYIFSFYNGTTWSNQSADYTSNTEISVTKNVSSGVISWIWYVNDTHGNINQTSTSSVEIPSTTSSTNNNGGTQQNSESAGGSYIVTRSSNSDLLEFKVFAEPNKSVLDDIKNNQNTSIKQFEIKAKNWINGEIYVVSSNSTPENCQINYNKEYILYEALEINSTFNSSLIDDARVRFGVSKNWISNNNVSLIKAVKCHPYYQELKTDYIDEDDANGIYDIYSNGFSTLAIIGTQEPKTNIKNESSLIPHRDPGKKSRGYLLVLFIIILTLIIIILIKNKGFMTEKIKIKTKWFSIEESFSFHINKWKSN